MIKNFTDLEAWKEAHALTLLVYMATKEFPKEESYGLTSQLRRASISVESCIAEGFARYHYKDRVQFYPPSQNTTAVRPWMNAKSFRFGGIPLPTKQQGEDTGL